jgi:D-lactate dehydrogenase
MVPSNLRPALEPIVGAAQVLDRPVDRVAFAADASVYRLIPQAIVFPRTVGEVQALFRFSHDSGTPLTFRGAGTSLSGQAISDGVLVELARHWRGAEVLDGGLRVRVQPGIIGGQVNALLRSSRAKIGPDPASINACTMGGILANNSSGMCCGVAQNAYHTLESLVFVLPSGTAIDTSRPDAEAEFQAREPALARGLMELKGWIEADAALAAKIRRKYRIKNTTGYSLNAFLDYGTPLAIFRNLLIGSEGTLAFIAEAVLRTVPDFPVKVTGLLLFPDLHRACAAIGPLKGAGAAALELLDRPSLRSVEDQPGVPAGIRGLPEGAAALLTEFQAAAEAERAGLEEAALAAGGGLALLEPAAFTHRAAEQDALWKVRRGIIPSAGALRARGTSVILEDVAFPVEELADAAVELAGLFRQYDYPDATIFGHAKDGNLHFVLTQAFDTAASVDRYRRFTDAMVRLVVDRHQGSLKAEHGTGRNMAPFVEAEWGPEALAVMRRLKALADPRNLLNPDVILNPDPAAHLAYLKALPPVEEEVDRCIECGWCESKCPSRDLTLSPRQRIVVRREIARLASSGEDPATRRSLEAAFQYMGVDTCAADGLCATACPVSIDTGALIKRLRRQAHSPRAQALALGVARHLDRAEPVVRLGLRCGRALQALLGARALGALSRAAHRLTGRALPQWIEGMPLAAKSRLPATEPGPARAVYVPSCISRTMGRLPGEPGDFSLPELVVALAERAGVPVHIPAGVRGTCCGVPFASKGYADAHRHAVNAAIERFWDWSREGTLPVVLDTSPCAHGLRTCRPYLSPDNQARFDRLTLLDPVAFAHDLLLPGLTVRRKLGPVVLHPVCSVIKMDLAGKLQALAEACAERVIVPREAGCCGFAGDRGFLFPELTAAATRREAAELRGTPCAGHYSSSRTCEVGLARATGQVYRSVLYLLEAATR